MLKHMLLHDVFLFFRFPDNKGTCLKFHFIEILSQAMGAGKWNVHLRNSCHHLRIVHLSPEVAPVCQYLFIIIC